MSRMKTFEQLEQRVHQLEKEAVEGKRAKRTLQQSLREISFLNALGYQVTSNLSFDQVAQSALDGIFKLINLDLFLYPSWQSSSKLSEISS